MTSPAERSNLRHEFDIFDEALRLLLGGEIQPPIFKHIFEQFLRIAQQVALLLVLIDDPDDVGRDGLRAVA